MAKVCPPPSEPNLPGMEPDLPQPGAPSEIVLGENEELVTGKDGKLYIRRTHDSRNYKSDGTYEVVGQVAQMIELTENEVAKRAADLPVKPGREEQKFDLEDRRRP